MKRPEHESILVVDDDLVALALYETILNDAGYTHVIVSSDGREVPDRIRDNDISLVLLDINMPGKSGIEVLEDIVADYPGLPVIMITGDEELQTAVRCMRIGAYDYLNKPPEQTRLVTAVHHALEWRDLNSELSAMGSRVLHRDSLEKPEAFQEMITVSDSLLAVFQYVEAVAVTSRPVLVTGESGTGKELLARSVHAASGREGSMVTVNVAGLDDALFSDTLFGHTKGAFTDASTDRPGLVEKAAGGTLFLDEIGDLAPASQVKLLRLLQEREYYPLGSDEPRITDARIVAATCIDLSKRLDDGRFRRDLFFRLMAHHVTLPPLRERREDLMPLAQAFLREAADELGKKVPRIPAELEAMLNLYDFPGNVRELHSLVFDALSRSGGTVLNLTPFRDLVGTDVLPEVRNQECQEVSWDYEGLVQLFGHFPTVKEFTDILFDAAVEKADGNQSLASRLLGVNQSTLSRRLAKRDV
jgi:DNA-binding NtrC family response regulator